MQAEFLAPKRRTRVHEEYRAPLPVGPQEKGHFRAELINQHVLVCHPEHILKIHNQGYFGKGILSRAGPEHGVSDRWEEHEGLLLPVVSQSRYEKLLRWAEETLSAQGLDEDAVSQTLLRLSQPVGTDHVRRAEEEGDRRQEEEEEEGDRRQEEEEEEGDRRQEEEEEGDRRQEEEEEGDRRQEEEGRVEAEVCPHTKRPRLDPRDLKPEQDPDPTSHSDPGCLVPGPGFVLVCDSEDGRRRRLRRTPLSLSEHLQLSLEEAFFLGYSLGCLSVYLQQEPLSVSQLWRTFRSLSPDFISSYAAYHHFRSRGWVPKTGGGAKYGVDLMLYRKGPPFYHSSYSVVIERTDDAFRSSGLRPFSWRSLAALSRITANVSKELMLCYVIYPADLSEAELDSPVCLSRLKVQEVIVSRWVSSRERAEQDDF